jgi:hypothetical protein
VIVQGVEGGEDLFTGQTYEYEHPFFEWNGASDGNSGSGVDGYFVYFGTDSSANPALEGSYQSSSKYVVTSAMTAGNTYYLRIKVKDKMGYVSSAATYFSYRYWFISPPGNLHFLVRPISCKESIVILI